MALQLTGFIVARFSRASLVGGEGFSTIGKGLVVSSHGFLMQLMLYVLLNSHVANALEALGFKKGDAIAIDMPMNVHAVTAYLAIILAGCVVVSIPDSFVAHEIAVRVRLSHAKAVFTQVCTFALPRSVYIKSSSLCVNFIS